MIHKLEFTKVSGAGNDFVVLDNRSGSLTEEKGPLAVLLCSRHFGIGADGLLVIESSEMADFKMLYYNADGSYGGMCGNGGRCIARFAFLNGIAHQTMRFESLDFVYEARVLGENVNLVMKSPGPLIPTEVSYNRETYSGYKIDTGSPHFVYFVEDVEAVDVREIGRRLREDEAFQPDGANINFVQMDGGDHIRLRTYERGVEAETLACGTGAVAAAITTSTVKGMKLPIQVHVKSGEFLTVGTKHDSRKTISPTLEGSAHILFTGSILYDSSNRAILSPLRRSSSE